MEKAIGKNAILSQECMTITDNKKKKKTLVIKDRDMAFKKNKTIIFLKKLNIDTLPF